ncbi:MAG TPA: hypothetical protein VK155_01515, partial [Bacteroidales bacterium]|nr:hypothetical protein [Bacteroidales bacterium]
MKKLSIALLFLFSVAASAYAQGTIRGRWELSPGEKGLEFYFSSRDDDGNGHMSMTETISKQELKGYTNGADVKFSLVREAGNIEMTGNTQNDKGEGTFVFTPDQAYVKAMSAEGI